MLQEHVFLTATAALRTLSIKCIYNIAFYRMIEVSSTTAKKYTPNNSEHIMEVLDDPSEPNSGEPEAEAEAEAAEEESSSGDGTKRSCCEWRHFQGKQKAQGFGFVRLKFVCMRRNYFNMFIVFLYYILYSNIILYST
jgi:hypothetical protein